MDKSQLRKETITYLKSLPESKKKTIEEKLTFQLIRSELWKSSNSVGITISQGFEWNTTAIIEAAWEENKTISVPKCDPVNKGLNFYQLHSYDQLEVVYYNLKEPNPSHSKATDKTNIDLLIVPGLLFDRNGYRVGFGGGYYDRFLANFTNTTVSLVSNNQLVDEVPTESFDLPVNHLISENGVI